MGGMVGALIAVMGLIAAVWGLSWFQHRGVADPARTVDYSAALAAASEQAPFHVVAPSPVPTGLRATSVNWDGVGARVSWHLGFITPGQGYIGLYQGNGPASRFVAASTPATRSAPSVTVVGQAWRMLTAPDRGETALVHTLNGVTIVVTGTVDEAQLATFVSRLH